MTRKADGPALARWVDDELTRLPGSPSRSEWAKAHAFYGSYLGRWQTGTEPSIAVMSDLATALGRPFVDILIAAGVLTPEEVGAPPLQHTTQPTPEQAIAGSDLTSRTKESLLTLLKAMRELEAGGHVDLVIEA